MRGTTKPDLATHTNPFGTYDRFSTCGAPDRFRSIERGQTDVRHSCNVPEGTGKEIQIRSNAD